VTASKIRLLVRAISLGLTTIASTLFSEITPELVAAIVAATEGILQVFVREHSAVEAPEEGD